MKTRTLLSFLLILLLGLSVTAMASDLADLKHEVLVSGLSHPWGLAQLPDGALLFTQRGGSLHWHKEGQTRKIADISGVYARGEGGLMGIAVDPDFAQNGYIYLAYNQRIEARHEVVVSRFHLDSELALSDTTVIVGDLPAISSGRHSGTALAMGADGVLWIGTGDAATGSNPQDPKSMGGKILRVDRDGRGVPGNLSEPFDPRVFSYGHRNTQGLVLLPQPMDGVAGYSAEHGSNIEDEFNALLPGNFGWDPPPPYREVVPMTDKARYPDAIDAVWNSGPATIAVSGLAQLRGTQWGQLENAFVMGVLKRQQLRVLVLDNGKLSEEHTLFEGQFGRIRAVLLGQDGSLYLSTDNGNDSIIRVWAE